MATKKDVFCFYLFNAIIRCIPFQVPVSGTDEGFTRAAKRTKLVDEVLSMVGSEELIHRLSG